MNRISGILVCLFWIFSIGHCLAETTHAHPEMPVSNHHHHHGEGSADPLSHANGDHGEDCEIAACKPEYSSIFTHCRGMGHDFSLGPLATSAGVHEMHGTPTFLKTQPVQTESATVFSLRHALCLAPNAPPFSL